MRVIKNPDIELVKDIERSLNGMKEQYGEYYCPCAFIRTPDTICMCKEFREQNYPGECHCGRFIKIDE